MVRIRTALAGTATLLTLGLLLAAETASQDNSRPPGDDKSLKTRVLEAGAKLLQSSTPLEPMDVYLVGFHPMKEHPEHQMEAHHYCHQVNEDFAQCALFDGNGKDARLNGIEYIISEKLFESLPAEERRFWHPHNAEILSGQLVAPGIPQVAEKELMRSKMNSYGKTWHVWNTGMPGQRGDSAAARAGRSSRGRSTATARRGPAWSSSATGGWMSTAQRSVANAPNCARWPGRSPVSTTCVRRFRTRGRSPVWSTRGGRRVRHRLAPGASR